MSSSSIVRLVRALSKPYPGASFFHESDEYKVWDAKTHVINLQNIEPGKVLNVEKNKFLIKTGDNAIEIIDVEPILKINVGDYL